MPGLTSYPPLRFVLPARTQCVLPIEAQNSSSTIGFQPSCHNLTQSTTTAPPTFSLKVVRQQDTRALDNITTQSAITLATKKAILPISTLYPTCRSEQHRERLYLSIALKTLINSKMNTRSKSGSPRKTPSHAAHSSENLEEGALQGTPMALRPRPTANPGFPFTPGPSTFSNASIPHLPPKPSESNPRSPGSKAKSGSHNSKASTAALANARDISHVQTFGSSSSQATKRVDLAQMSPQMNFDSLKVIKDPETPPQVMDLWLQYLEPATRSENGVVPMELKAGRPSLLINSHANLY
ncbi:MAG: hypothetical protein Q9169_006886 [Polycauliona sp. 2 TL-2023]